MGAYDFGKYRLAWPRMGKLSDNPSYDDLRKNWAIQSIQRELSFNGIDPGPINGIYNFNTYLAVRQFQKARGLKRDGQCGLYTLKSLFATRFEETGAENRVPPKILCGLAYQESGFDPGAVGFVNPHDRGMYQINSEAHPSVEDEAAFNAQFSVEWTATRLRATYKKFRKQTGKRILAWKCTIASHNSPAQASEWAETGVAPSEQIKNYVDKVLSLCGSEL